MNQTFQRFKELYDIFWNALVRGSKKKSVHLGPPSSTIYIIELYVYDSANYLNTLCTVMWSLDRSSMLNKSHLFGWNKRTIFSPSYTNVEKLQNYYNIITRYAAMMMMMMMMLDTHHTHTHKHTFNNIIIKQNHL